MAKKNSKNGNGNTKPTTTIRTKKKEQECKNKRQALTQIKRLKWNIDFRSNNQKKFYEAIDKNEVVFCSGPAGCGKTYIAVYYALQALADKKNPYDGIIIAKPLVEANGEKIGYLPGDIEEKTYPFMMSFYYNMEQLIGKQRLKTLTDESVVQVVPLAYMRGLTLSHKIVILDECQNSIPEQIKMFLTRIGEYSKFIVCGDLDQTDRRGVNGLEDAMYRFKDLDGVGFTTFHKEDIVRHKIVAKLLDRYENVHYD